MSMGYITAFEERQELAERSFAAGVRAAMKHFDIQPCVADLNALLRDAMREHGQNQLRDDLYMIALEFPKEIEEIIHEAIRKSKETK